MSQCRLCLLPDRAPGAALDGQHVCSFCHAQRHVHRDEQERLRHAREADLELALEGCRDRGEYDCLVNLSGGKDSCYLLYKLKAEYDLNVLAFTTDMNVPEVAWRNIERTVSKLDVPHIVYTPPREFYRKMYRFLLQNQESRGAVRTVCYVCAPLFEAYALRLAVEKRIPLIVAGYSPGQPDPDRMEYEFAPAMIRDRDWTPPELRASGLFGERELRLFWNPRDYPPGTAFPRYLAPFHAWNYNQEETMRVVVQLGLAANRRHASPVHSNCPVNWLLMYSDLRNLGYNPYAPEFSRLIREGKARRGYWRVMGALVNFMIRRKVGLGRNVRDSLAWLGLRAEDLRIARPAPPPGFVPLDQLQPQPSRPAAADSACRRPLEECAHEG